MCQRQLCRVAGFRCLRCWRGGYKPCGLPEPNKAHRAALPVVNGMNVSGSACPPLPLCLLLLLQFPNSDRGQELQRLPDSYLKPRGVELRKIRLIDHATIGNALHMKVLRFVLLA